MKNDEGPNIVAEGYKSRMNRLVDVASSSIASGFAWVAGLWASSPATKQPVKPLELYEFESCPFCRKVREALSMFDLDAHVFPCPPKGTRYRPGVVEKGGKAMFPYLVDPNTGVSMYESDDIVRYLASTYGAPTVPLALRLGPLTNMRSFAASAVRMGFGKVRSSRAPAEMLELYSFEASPFCRIAREELTALEIPYKLHNVAKGSKKREAFVARSGKMMVPYLIDPNQQVEMFESADIVQYLRRTYGA